MEEEREEEKGRRSLFDFPHWNVLRLMNHRRGAEKEHHERDRNRDRYSGRIYRLSFMQVQAVCKLTNAA